MTYELTKFQFDALNHAANGPTRVFVILYDSPADLQETAALYRQQCREAGELFALGLTIDVSENFKESIERSKIDNNRDFCVYAITDLGMKMFEGFETRLVN